MRPMPSAEANTSAIASKYGSRVCHKLSCHRNATNSTAPRAGSHRSVRSMVAAGLGQQRVDRWRLGGEHFLPPIGHQGVENEEHRYA